MRKFIIKVLLLAAVCFASMFAVEHVITRNLRKLKSLMFAVWNDIYSGTMRHNVIIVGNSRALAQYNPEVIDAVLGCDSYNMGIGGHRINRQIIRYDAYRRHNTKPKAIIQNIDFTTLGLTVGFQKEHYFPYFDDKELVDAVSEYEKFGFAEKHLPLARYMGQKYLILEGFGINRPQAVLSKGHAGRDWPWDGTELAKIKTLHFATDQKSLRAFTNYLEKAVSEDIRVIFVYAPIYYGATEKFPDIADMYELYGEMARKYKIPVLDYMHDPLCYSTNYFYNAMHLNKTGADLFSAKLADDIKTLGLLDD